MEAAAGLHLHVLDPSAARSQYDVLFRNLGLISVDGVGRLRGQPLAQGGGQFGLQAAGIDPRPDAPQNVEPVGVWLFENAGLPLQDGFIVERNPEGGWVAVDPITEESRRRDPNNRERLVLDVTGGADHAGVGPVGGLPGLVAHYRDRRCAWTVVRRQKHATGICSQAEGGKVVAGYIFGGFCFRCDGLDADVHAVVSGLEGRQLFEVRRGPLEVTIQIVRKEVEIAAIVHESAIHAAVVQVADAVQTCRIGDRERFQQNRVYQGEYGGVRSDPERDGEDDRGGEARRPPKLAQRKFEIVHRSCRVWT